MTAPETSVGSVGTGREAPTPSPPPLEPRPIGAAAGSGVRVGGWPGGPVKNDSVGSRWTDAWRRGAANAGGRGY